MFIFLAKQEHLMNCRVDEEIGERLKYKEEEEIAGYYQVTNYIISNNFLWFNDELNLWVKGVLHLLQKMICL